MGVAMLRPPAVLSVKICEGISSFNPPQHVEWIKIDPTLVDRDGSEQSHWRDRPVRRVDSDQSIVRRTHDAVQSPESVRQPGYREIRIHYKGRKAGRGID